MEQALSKSEKEVNNRAKGASPTVLVVEDFDETRFVLKLAMELRGYAVLEALNGKEAVEIAQREPLDLILMDLSLPVMDGFAATRRIREEALSPDVPIIAVTAHATAEYRVKAVAAGCNEYVTKPVDFDKLGLLLNRLLPEATSNKQV